MRRIRRLPASDDEEAARPSREVGRTGDLPHIVAEAPKPHGSEKAGSTGGPPRVEGRRWPAGAREGGRVPLRLGG